ncbi:DUF2231 domain-containing protein [Novosphingobium sp. RD2P27]|uniref:DUF2231 domain-containing protein n=1 Tax=Novosphingobium kalidii TaxID=3230299 RepID=A0ABV2D2R5_9SPHN
MQAHEKRENQLTDPISSNPKFNHAESRIAIAGHPVHAMLVSFPIALTTCAWGADIFYWATGDLFWARAALWASGMAFLMGLLAGLSGTVELLVVPGIRARAASWTHFIIAMTLLAVLGANWGYRLYGYEEMLLPYGLLLSSLSAAFAGFAGWHGGKLVFDYQVGTSSSGS